MVYIVGVSENDGHLVASSMSTSFTASSLSKTNIEKPSNNELGPNETPAIVQQIQLVSELGD